MDGFFMPVFRIQVMQHGFLIFYHYPSAIKSYLPDSIDIFATCLFNITKMKPVLRINALHLCHRNFSLNYCPPRLQMKQF